MAQTQTLDFMEVSLLKENNHQALRIPLQFSLDTERVRLHREGGRLVIEPVHAHPLTALLDRWQPLPDDVPHIEDAPPAPKDIF